MKKSLLIASTLLLTASGFATADHRPSFSEADTNNDGTLNTEELTTAVPQLELETTVSTITAADVKRVAPEIEFSDEDVVNAEPIGEEQYALIVEAMAHMESAGSVSSL